MLQGSLFTSDYLENGIVESPTWAGLGDTELGGMILRIKQIFDDFPHDRNPNEPQTEDDLIWQVLGILGWEDFLRQQTLAAKGREHVPDGLLFADAAAKARANTRKHDYLRYSDGLTIIESKRWNRFLDRKDNGKDEIEVPSSQMLRYLRRVEDLTDGKIRWGILSNGRQWRLYFQGAKSVSEDFLELDLAALLGLAPYTDLFSPKTDAEKSHWLKVFVLMFRRASFLRDDGRSFHEIALDAGRLFEARVAEDLSNIVFEKVFPDLARALITHAPDAPVTLSPDYLAQVKEATLILLYRLFFVLYAEDRNLLPVADTRYDDYGLREKVRRDVARRIDAADTFSDIRTTYWQHAVGLFDGIANGDRSIGLPPYNGGLFDANAAPLLKQAALPDSVFAPVIDWLGRIDDPRGGRRYVNYRDLSVRQLGSIYERLLEYDLFANKDGIEVRLNTFGRRDSGSYYTPDELVRLIIERTVGPLIKEREAQFTIKAAELKPDRREKLLRLAELAQIDPASAILDLKICDPAMGSGHFLVDLVDYLADRIIEATEAARVVVEWGEYGSPLLDRIADIRARIQANAKQGGWTVAEDQLDDRLIVRRMILKRCIFGVDKNPMAVELAKVALWLHTFTVGAPLSFLDHHLRCGDSLFGETVRGVMDRLAAKGALMINAAVQRAKNSASGMLRIETITDADIAEVKASADIFHGVEQAIAPLTAFMDVLHAFLWLDPAETEDRKAIDEWLDGNFGEPFEIALGRLKPQTAEAEQSHLFGEVKPRQQSLMRGATARAEVAERFVRLLAKARELVALEHFHHWEVAFPGVWTDWESLEHHGGFDAVIGNPPWDRIKFQEVEWFAVRKPEIALAATADRRAQMVDKLKKSGDPLAAEYARALARAQAMSRMARGANRYPLLSGGDTNIYSLFVERALSLIKPDGMVGLLTPSGIASDKTASEFFQQISTGGRLAALFDFENRRPPKPHFFPAVDSRFKFCTVIIGGKKRRFENAQCGFYLRDVEEINDPERGFTLAAKDFALVNPNTGTAPVFRTRRDAQITTAIYASSPVLVDRSDGAPVSVWPVRYMTMFHMTNDSGLFRTAKELHDQGAYPVDGNRWKRGAEIFVPLYEGKMVQAYDHRAASIEVDSSRLHRPGQPVAASDAQHADPNWSPEPQFWVNASEIKLPSHQEWVLGFKEITAPTNMRTMIGALLPRAGFGNKVPILIAEQPAPAYSEWAALLCANFNSLPFDFVTRQKVHGQTLNLFLLEQLPVIPPQGYTRRFGKKTAAEIVREQVLALTYTAHDLAAFARDMGHDGPPFIWNALDRAHRRARLDALYFLLYGVTSRDDVEYIFSTFPIVAREDQRAWGRYLSRDLCLAYMNALQAGDPDVRVDLH